MSAAGCGARNPALAWPHQHLHYLVFSRWFLLPNGLDTGNVSGRLPEFAGTWNKRLDFRVGSSQKGKSQRIIQLTIKARKLDCRAFE